ncbi:Diacetylchitobiose uptake system permease protein DasC [subsurface metagenome]
MKQYYSIRQNAKSVLLYVAVGVILLFFVFPIFWACLAAFKSRLDLFSQIPTLIFKPTLSNFRDVFYQQPFLKYLKNSLIIAGCTTAVTVSMSAYAGYLINRFRIGGPHISFWILTLRMMPPVVIIIPYFLIFRVMRLLDTYLALVLMYSVMNFPLAMWLMMGFFQEVPRELEEASWIDGCSLWKGFISVVLPLVLPGIVVASLFTFIFSWNEFLFAVVLSRDHARTAPVGITLYIQIREILWGQLMASGILAIAPVVVIAMFIRKYLIRGLMLGALK